MVLKPNRKVSNVIRSSNKHTLYVVDEERCRHGWFFCCNKKNANDYKIKKSCFRTTLYNKIKQAEIGCNIFFFLMFVGTTCWKRIYCHL